MTTASSEGFENDTYLMCLALRKVTGRSKALVSECVVEEALAFDWLSSQLIIEY